MSYQDELNRLQSIITADGSTDEQRNAARAAQAKLIDNSIEEAFKRIENRTKKFNSLMRKLKGVVDKISANQLTGVIDTLNNVVGDVQKAAKKKVVRPRNKGQAKTLARQFLVCLTTTECKTPRKAGRSHTMRGINDAGLELVKSFEGIPDGDPTTVKIDPYLDPIGIWTIGRGHATRVGSDYLRGKENREAAMDLYSEGITEEQAKLLKGLTKRRAAGAALFRRRSR